MYNKPAQRKKKLVLPLLSPCDVWAINNMPYTKPGINAKRNNTTCAASMRVHRLETKKILRPQINEFLIKGCTLCIVCYGLPGVCFS